MGTDDWRPVHRDVGEDESPSTAVIAAVGDATGVGPTELAPLGETVDVDALDTVAESAGTDATITFEYAGVQVTVHGNDSVVVQSLADEVDPDTDAPLCSDER